MLQYRIRLSIFLLFVTMALNAQNVSQHIVKRGETFASIAKKYGISEQQLKKANSKHATCYTGMKLSIPQISETSNASKQISKVENKSNNVQDSQSPIIHTTAKSEEKQADENKDVAQVYGKKEKRKKSFWKKLSSVMSTIGDISVATAEGLVETGLVSENSNAGVIITSSADLTHTLRGEETKYLSDDIETQSSHIGEREYASKNDKDMIHLPSLANKLESEIRKMEQEISEGDRIMQAYHKRNSVKTRIGSTYVTAISRNAPPAPKVYHGVTKSVIQGTIKELQTRLKWVKGKQMRGLEYIPKSEYDAYLGRRQEQHKEDVKAAKEMRKELREPRTNHIYDNYIQLLSNAYYFPEHHPMTRAEVKKIQNQMKRVRENSKRINKSKWEYWDGIPGSMD